MARLIDADALMKRYDLHIVIGAGDNICIDIADIAKAPTVDAVPVVHGRWEEWWPGISLIMTGEEMLHMCSSCGAKYADIEGYKHCPNCGALMDLEVKDDT